MKLNKTFYLLAICAATMSTHGQNIGANTRNDAGAAELAAQEQSYVAAAHAAAARHDDTACVAELVRPVDAKLGIADSLGAIRRTATVCALLANENDYPAAKRVARLGIARLASVVESTPADRVERLYWESWLQLGMLDSPAEAIATLRIAERIAPNDERLATIHKRADAAVTAHGH